MNSLTEPRRHFKAATLDELAEALRGEGYQPGTPPQLSRPARVTDADACRAMRCPGCRHKGMDYHPFHNGRHYRALAACPVCDTAEEV
jgi:hypothetical protein